MGSRFLSIPSDDRIPPCSKRISVGINGQDWKSYNYMRTSLSILVTYFCSDVPSKNKFWRRESSGSASSWWHWASVVINGLDISDTRYAVQYGSHSARVEP